MDERVRWPTQVVLAAVMSARAGTSSRIISEALDVPIETIRTWRGGRIPVRAQRVIDGVGSCEVCGAAAHRWDEIDSETYAYLLGVYLGDGLVKRSSGTFALRVFLDSKYPDIVASVADAIAAIRGRPPHVRPATDGRNMVTLTSYWKPWQCLFPQHGPGRKHSRPIVLTDWQQRIVDEAPGALLRGLIHTDGWRGVNRVRSKGRWYEYPRYQFSNRSDDIRRIFTAACDRLGVAWRPWGRWHISVARKDSVALLDRHVGLKH